MAHVHTRTRTLYVNEHQVVTLDGLEVLVHRYTIAATDLLVYDAYEPSRLFGPHSTIYMQNGRVWGDIWTRTLSPETAILPVGEDRLVACAAERARHGELKRRAILLAWPEAAAGKVRYNGGIETRVGVAS